MKRNYPISNHSDGKRFFNPDLKIIKRFWHVLKMLASRRKTPKWPTSVKNHAKPMLATLLNPHQTHITYINHATHLIQLKGLTLLTDPIFAKRAGPLSIIGPKRVREPGILLKDLPPIDLVLISHNHFDHMDLASLAKLNKKYQPLFIVPLGNKKYLMQKKIKKIIELDWWEKHTLNETQSVTLVPAQHWSMRRMGGANDALWGGFWIQSDQLKIYFAGDTGYGKLFQDIYARLGSPNVSILPIGSYEPQWFMKPQHMNPEEAVLAHLALKSHLSLATHHLTFRLSHEEIDAPSKALRHSMAVHHVNPREFLIPENGETVIYITEECAV